MQDKDEFYKNLKVKLDEEVIKEFKIKFEQDLEEKHLLKVLSLLHLHLIHVLIFLFFL